MMGSAHQGGAYFGQDSGQGCPSARSGLYESKHLGDDNQQYKLVNDGGTIWGTGRAGPQLYFPVFFVKEINFPPYFGIVGWFADSCFLGVVTNHRSPVGLWWVVVVQPRVEEKYMAGLRTRKKTKDDVIIKMWSFSIFSRRLAHWEWPFSSQLCCYVWLRIIPKKGSCNAIGWS